MSNDKEFEKWAEAKMAKDQIFHKDVTIKQVSETNKFWCCRRLQWTHSVICQKRRSQEAEGCVKCEQGALVVETLGGSEVRPKKHRAPLV